MSYNFRNSKSKPFIIDEAVINIPTPSDNPNIEIDDINATR